MLRSFGEDNSSSEFEESFTSSELGRRGDEFVGLKGSSGGTEPQRVVESDISKNFSKINEVANVFDKVGISSDGSEDIKCDIMNSDKFVSRLASPNSSDSISFNTFSNVSFSVESANILNFDNEVENSMGPTGIFIDINRSERINSPNEIGSGIGPGPLAAPIPVTNYNGDSFFTTLFSIRNRIPLLWKSKRSIRNYLLMNSVADWTNQKR